MAARKSKDEVGDLTGVLVKLPETLRDEIEYIAEKKNESVTGRILTLLEGDVETFKKENNLKVIPQTAIRKAKNKSKK